MLPAEAPWDYARLFSVERGRLLELLTGLRATDWGRPSPCPGWTVLGLCCHLVGDDLGQLARNRDGHFGTPAPAGPEADFPRPGRRTSRYRLRRRVFGSRASPMPAPPTRPPAGR